MNNIYINIKDVAEAKGLKSTRSLRLELNKNESKYISREIKVNGGTSYEILFSSLEPELQDKLRKNENKTTELVPLNYQPPQFVSDQAKMTANFRLNIIIVGYEIMMTESTQCIASALRNAIINLGLIPKVVYQDNGKAFKSRFFQNVDFEEDLFNGVYANLNIHSVFAKPYNARAKVIERFFREFQEELEKGMPSYIGTSIEDKPAWLKRGEKLHAEWHKKLTDNHIPSVSEASKYINSWIEFHNNQPCPNDRTKTIKECLNSVQKQNIDVQRLDDLMMKTEGRTINKHGITFLNMHYRSEAILGIRDKVNIRYSLFDLSKVNVYSKKGEFICVAHRVQKVHPMARVLGTVKDMEEYKYQYEKQQKIKNRLVKQIKKTFPKEELQVLDIVPEPTLEIEQFEPEKMVREHKLTPREKQMNKPMFDSDFEKYEWLMNNGCTNPEDRKWLADYIRSNNCLDVQTTTFNREIGKCLRVLNSAFAPLVSCWEYWFRSSTKRLSQPGLSVSFLQPTSR